MAHIRAAPSPTVGSTATLALGVQMREAVVAEEVVAAIGQALMERALGHEPEAQLPGLQQRALRIFALPNTVASGGYLLHPCNSLGVGKREPQKRLAAHSPGDSSLLEQGPNKITLAHAVVRRLTTRRMAQVRLTAGGSYMPDIDDVWLRIVAHEGERFT